VVVAQKLLLSKGYTLGGYGATGNFYSYTLAAVKRYQTNNALTVNGIVDQPTWKKLAVVTYSISYGPNYTSRIVLTYDDCPKSLDAMKAMVRHAKSIGVGMVLAPTGDCIRAGRFDAAYARSYGQYVINHSVSHPNLTKLSYSSMVYQLGAPGVVTNFGRPPYGAYNSIVQDAYAYKAMKIWTWNVDTRDWEGKTTNQVVSYVVANAFNRSTVLMHMQWNGFTPTGLSNLKSGLQATNKYVCRPYAGTTPVKLPAKLPC
jgi:peptidoglycan/xylan/chitin deacetylase (PgdA/CDA1 family)